MYRYIQSFILQVQELNILNTSLEDKTAIAIQNINNLENQLQAKKDSDILLEELKIKISAVELDLSNTVDALNSAKYQLNQSEEKNKFLTKELEVCFIFIHFVLFFLTIFEFLDHYKFITI